MGVTDDIASCPGRLSTEVLCYRYFYERERKERLDVEIKNMIWLFRMVGLDE